MLRRILNSGHFPICDLFFLKTKIYSQAGKEDLNTAILESKT